MPSEPLKKSVFLISNMYPLYPGDSYGVFVKNFEAALHQSALQVVVKSTIKGKGKNLFQKARKYIKFYSSILYNGFFKSYDLIYCHNVSHSVLPVFLLQAFRNKKLILNAHGEDILPTTTFGKFLGNFIKFIINRSTLLVVPSVYFKEVVEEKFGLNADRIFVSPSGGVNLQVFRPADSTLRPDSFTIGFVSRIEINKGYRIFLQAIKEINDNYKDIHFKAVMAGGGGQQLQLEQFIQENKLQEIVRFIGPQPQDKLVDVFSQMDLLVFPTLFKESLGLIGLEAMACGIPVIGSRSGGLTDYILPNENGLFFEPGNVSELVQKIVYFYGLPAKSKEEMKVNALETAKRFEKDLVANNLIHKICMV